MPLRPPFRVLRRRRNRCRRRRTAAILLQLYYHYYILPQLPLLLPSLYVVVLFLVYSLFYILLCLYSRVCRVPLGEHPSARVCLSKPPPPPPPLPPPPFFESVQQYIIILLCPVILRLRGYTGCYTNLSTRLSCPSAAAILMFSSSTITANIDAADNIL